MNLIHHLQKITYISLFAFMLFAGLQSCGEKPEEPKGELNVDEDYYDFKGLSLASHDLDAMIMLPDNNANIGASTKPEVIHTEGGFTWEINVGPNFQLFIEDQADYSDLIEYKKKKLKEQTLFKINYLVEDKDMLIYEQELLVRGDKKASPKVGVQHKSYHVYALKEINGIYYELKSRDEGFEKMIIELVAKSIKSFKPIK